MNLGCLSFDIRQVAHFFRKSLFLTQTTPKKGAFRTKKNLLAQETHRIKKRRFLPGPNIYKIYQNPAKKYGPGRLLPKFAISSSYLTPFSEYFSSFPHGTCALSVLRS